MRYSKEIREEAVRRMIRAEEILEEMKPITMHALTKRYKVCWKTLTRMERGEQLCPKNMTAREVDQALSDLRKCRELEKLFETRQQIADNMGIENYKTKFEYWIKDYRDRKKALDRFEYHDPAVEFLTMPTVVRNPVQCFYY